MSGPPRLAALLLAASLTAGPGAARGESRSAVMAVTIIVVTPACFSGNYASAAERAGCAVALAARAGQAAAATAPAAAPATPVVTRDTAPDGTTRVLQIY
ncbi:MAG: hypothetical protein ACOYOH_21305 [Paracraurococcus sp.]